MEPIWKKHWPTTVDEKSIRLPEEVLPVILARQAKLVPDRPAIHFYGRAITFAELDAASGCWNQLPQAHCGNRARTISVSRSYSLTRRSATSS